MKGHQLAPIKYHYVYFDAVIMELCNTGSIAVYWAVMNQIFKIFEVKFADLQTGNEYASDAAVVSHFSFV